MQPHLHIKYRRVCLLDRAYLVMVMACIVAASTDVAAADSSTRCRQSGGPLHGAARLLKRQGARGLRRRVVNVVDEVVSVAVAVDVTVAVLRAAGLLRGRGLHAA